MDLRLIKLFQMQIWIQCKFAALAYDELTAQLAERSSNPRAAWEKDRDRSAALSKLGLSHEELTARSIEVTMEPGARAWHPVQSLLTATANISKALWGQGGKLTTGREPLRRSLDVDEDSPLKPTSMRNNFDHFDERLDAWWDRSVNHNYVDLGFGDVHIGGIPEDEMFRSLNPQTGDLVFWGERYNLPEIMAEIHRIMPIAIRRFAERPPK